MVQAQALKVVSARPELLSPIFQFLSLKVLVEQVWCVCKSWRKALKTDFSYEAVVLNLDTTYGLNSVEVLRFLKRMPRTRVHTLKKVSDKLPEQTLVELFPNLVHLILFAVNGLDLAHCVKLETLTVVCERSSYYLKAPASLPKSLRVLKLSSIFITDTAAWKARLNEVPTLTEVRGLRCIWSLEYIAQSMPWVTICPDVVVDLADADEERTLLNALLDVRPHGLQTPNLNVSCLYFEASLQRFSGLAPDSLCVLHLSSQTLTRVSWADELLWVARCPNLSSFGLNILSNLTEFDPCEDFAALGLWPALVNILLAGRDSLRLLATCAGSRRLTEVGVYDGMADYDEQDGKVGEDVMFDNPPLIDLPAVTELTLENTMSFFTYFRLTAGLKKINIRDRYKRINAMLLERFWTTAMPCVKIGSIEINIRSKGTKVGDALNWVSHHVDASSRGVSLSVPLAMDESKELGESPCLIDGQFPKDTKLCLCWQGLFSKYVSTDCWTERISFSKCRHKKKEHYADDDGDFAQIDINCTKKSKKRGNRRKRASSTQRRASTKRSAKRVKTKRQELLPEQGHEQRSVQALM